MPKTVEAYDPETHLSGLLDEVARGETFVITKHGRPVARLAPVSQPDGSPEDVVKAFLDARRGVRLGDLSVRQMIEE